MALIFLFVFFNGIEIVPVGIIAGGTVGCSILLFLCLLVLVLFLYRQRKGSKLSKTTDTNLHMTLSFSFFIFSQIICNYREPFKSLKSVKFVKFLKEVGYAHQK